jgi:mRNA-degrading endonuclease YafQ of YafQ-DinJ toxin-antitoxin module
MTNLTKEEKDKLIEIIARQVTTGVLSNPNEYFKGLAERAELPDQMINEIAGVWSGDSNKDARKFIDWAINKTNKGVNNTKDKYLTTLGCILGVLLEDMGPPNQNFIFKLISKYELCKSNFLDELRQKHKIYNDPSNNNENFIPIKQNPIPTPSPIDKSDSPGYEKDTKKSAKIKIRTKIRTIGTVLILISALSVFLSYYQLYPLKNKFSDLNDCKIMRDFFIETIRSFIIISWLTIDFFSNLFLKEVLEIFYYRRPSRDLKKYITWARIALLFFVILGIIFLVIYHLYYAPEIYLKTIKCNTKVYNKLCWEQIKKSFLFYMPYSFINFICIAIPVFIIGLYAEIKDLKRLESEKQKTINKIERISASTEHNNIIFKQFGNFYIKKLKRYIRLGLIFISVFSFEILISIKAAGVAAITITIVGLIFLSFVFIILYRALMNYEDIWNKIDSNSINSFYSPNIFIKELFAKNYVTLLSSIIIIIVYIIMNYMLDLIFKNCLSKLIT